MAEHARSGVAEAAQRGQIIALAHRFTGAREQGRRTEYCGDIERMAVGAPQREVHWHAALERSFESIAPRQIAIKRVWKNIQRAEGQQDERGTVARRELGNASGGAIAA